MTNGIVRAAAVHDETLYIGGNFTRVAPAADFLGPWFAVSTASGAALPRLPVADGPVFAMEPDGAGGYFVGGQFSHIGGAARTALAAARATQCWPAGDCWLPARSWAPRASPRW